MRSGVRDAQTLAKWGMRGAKSGVAEPLAETLPVVARTKRPEREMVGHW